MLKVPADGEATPPLILEKVGKITPVSLPESFQKARERKADVGAAAEGGAGEMRRRRRSPRDEDQPDWDKVPTKKLVRVSKPKSSHKLLWVGGGLLTLSLIAALILLARRENAGFEPIAIAPVFEPPVEIKESVPEPVELPQEMNRSEAELIDELEPLTRKFLEAETVDELLTTVRDSKRLEEKIRSYYPDGKVPAPGMSGFNTSKTLAYRGKLASLSVRTKDFENKQIAFLRTDEGMRVDWESFVGWSEMPWKQFTTEKPEKALLFRASLRKLDYYNFGFSDEKKWQSYELRSPDGEHVLYGYVERDSPLDLKLRPLDGKSTKLVTVKLKFPAGEEKVNQVLIDGMPVDGWVEGAGD